MKRAIIPLLLFIILTSSSRIYRPSHPPPLAHSRCEVPLCILWGVAKAESDYYRWAVSADGQDMGMFQLRAKYYKGIDPFDVVCAEEEAQSTLMRNYRVLRSWPRALTAYHCGINFEKRTKWVDKEYVKRVLTK